MYIRSDLNLKLAGENCLCPLQKRTTHKEFSGSEPQLELFMVGLCCLLSEEQRTITWEGNSVLSQITMTTLLGNSDGLS